MILIHFNSTKNESHSNNCDKRNYNIGNKIGSKE